MKNQKPVIPDLGDSIVQTMVKSLDRESRTYCNLTLDSRFRGNDAT